MKAKLPTAAEKGIKVGDRVNYLTPTGHLRQFTVTEIYWDDQDMMERIRGYYHSPLGTVFHVAPWTVKVEKVPEGI